MRNKCRFFCKKKNFFFFLGPASKKFVYTAHQFFDPKHVLRSDAQLIMASRSQRAQPKKVFAPDAQKLVRRKRKNTKKGQKKGSRFTTFQQKQQTKFSLNQIGCFFSALMPKPSEKSGKKKFFSVQRPPNFPCDGAGILAQKLQIKQDAFWRFFKNVHFLAFLQFQTLFFRKFQRPYAQMVFFLEKTVKKVAIRRL